MVMTRRRLWFSINRPRTSSQPDRDQIEPGSRSGKIAIDPGHPPEPLGPRRAGHSYQEPARQRILFINQYYWPDHASTAQHLADLAEYLAEQGHECHVLCAQGRYKPGEPKLPGYEVHEGVHIHRMPATSLGRRDTWARMTDYLSFYLAAILRALLLPRFDTVVTLTTPPIIGLIGTLLKATRSTRHIFWSMDLHPDASLALGRMRADQLFPRAMSWLANTVYRLADTVVVLGPYMADRIALKHVDPDRMITIPVWSRRDQIYSIPRSANPLRKSLGIGDAFVAMYSGNLGLAHSFDDFMAAAREMRDQDDVVFLFVGGGPRLREVEEARDRDNLSNIRVLDYFPRDQLHASLSLADVHLISMRPEMTGIVVPGKLYGVMAAGRPAIFVGPEHCETADTIRDSGCGFTIPTGDTQALVSALSTLANDPSVARRMGERARTAFLTSHERKLCCHQWHQTITALSNTRPAAAPVNTRQLRPQPAATPSFAINPARGLFP